MGDTVIATREFLEKHRDADQIVMGLGGIVMGAYYIAPKQMARIFFSELRRMEQEETHNGE